MSTDTREQVSMLDCALDAVEYLTGQGRSEQAHAVLSLWDSTMNGIGLAEDWSEADQADADRLNARFDAITQRLDADTQSPR